MKLVWKWVARIVTILLVLVVIVTSAGAWLVFRSWPQESGTIQVSGLKAKVEVLRDKWGVPNIYAQNEHDLFFAQGYVHAQDRLWQMEMIRRLASGTLSELIGEPTLDIDRYMRIMGLRRVAEQSWPKLSSETHTFLENYAAGVNAYIETHRDRLPVEYTLLGASPTAWTPIDSLMVGNMLALQMGLNQNEEFLQAQIAAKVGEARAKQLFQPDKDNPSIVPPGVKNYNWLQNKSAELANIEKWLGSSRWSWGSNNWVVSGSHTQSGKPFLANDTHVGLQAPSVWYENGLHGGRFDVAGFVVPGIPLVVLGHNKYIAWGITNLDPDVQDNYIEKLDDRKNPKKYEFMGKWYDLTTISEKIPVKGSQPVDLTILLTRHGPIVNLNKENEEPIALRWSLYEGSQVANSIIQLNMAKNWSEFHTALHDWDVLSQNFVYADIDGNIGYQTAGNIPIRGKQHAGTVPVPGWTGEYEWQGFIPYEELPSFSNPETGFIASANNKVTPDDYPYQLCSQYYPGFRAVRINDLLSNKYNLTSADMRSIQMDTYSLSAQALRPYLLSIIKPADDLQAKALDQLKAWDLYMEADRVGAPIYDTWFLFMLKDTISDEIGDDLEPWYQQDISTNEALMIEWMADPNTAWFDDVKTPTHETRDDMVQKSFADAVKWLSEHYGADPSQWKWGKLLTKSLTNAPIGQSGIPIIESFFNGGPVAASGGCSTINQSCYQWPEPAFNAVHGASQRLIMDLSDWNQTMAVNSTGQSGHIFHPNFKDQIPMFQAGEYHLLSFTRSAVEKNTQATLILEP